MDYQTEKVILHFVTEDDLEEVAGKWPADHHPLSDAEAREAIAYMRGNYERNTNGCIYHLCLAVCGKEHPETIMGWCGLDGTRNHSEPEIFILLEKEYRNKGYGTEALKRSVEYGFGELELRRIYLAVYADNLRAIHVYEKCGFIEYDRNDVDVFMEIVNESGEPASGSV